jgi:hypothetical protein
VLQDNQAMGGGALFQQAEQEPPLMQARARFTTQLEELRRELPCVALARMWIETLVEYAPFMKQLQQLDRECMISHADQVLPQLKMRLESYPFKKPEDLKNLELLLQVIHPPHSHAFTPHSHTPLSPSPSLSLPRFLSQGNAPLQHLKVASAILANKPLDGTKYAIDALKAVSLCAQSHSGRAKSYDVNLYTDERNAFIKVPYALTLPVLYSLRHLPPRPLLLRASSYSFSLLAPSFA